MTGHEYGWLAGYSAALMTSPAEPNGWLSTRSRRSFFTMSRCPSSFFWSSVGSRKPRRSDSSQSAVSSALLGMLS